MINDNELLDVVSNIHENGGDTGSAGWGSTWSRETAQQALLRTHTTVGTIRYLSDNPDPPVRVFSVGRVFRREALDSTHLPEFTQVEGIIVEPNANFGMLIGVLKEFYRRMGFDDVRVMQLLRTLIYLLDFFSYFNFTVDLFLCKFHFSLL